KRVFVIGAGPAGLEYARIASATGHAVAVYEREETVGGYIPAYGALPYRQQVVSRRRIIGLEKNIADLKSKLKKKTSNVLLKLKSRSVAKHSRSGKAEPSAALGAGYCMGVTELSNRSAAVTSCTAGPVIITFRWIGWLPGERSGFMK